MQVLLVHGMGRTAFSLYRLARHLQRDGHDTHLLGYVAAIESFDRIVGRIRTRLGELATHRQPPVLLPVRHTFMMNDRRVREVIRSVLAGAEA